MFRTCCRRRSSTSCLSARGRSISNEGGVTQALLGGWQLSTIFRYSSGTPVLLPRQRNLLQRAGPVPRRRASRPSPIRTPCSRRTRAASIRAKGRSSTRTRSSRCRAFNFYYGQGNRIEESVRGFAYHNQDLSFIKNTRMGGGTNLQIRFEMFNMWNWHIFGARGTTFNDTTAGFDLDLASPTFGAMERSRQHSAKHAAGGAVRILISGRRR